MRILVYAINYSPELTGVGKYAGEMCEWLAARGHEVRVITAPPYYPEWRVHEGYSGRRYRFESLRGVHVLRCPLWVPKRASGLKRVLHHLSFALSSFPVAFRQIFWRPDVVMMLEPPLMCAPTALLVARLCGAQSWLHVQDFEVDAAFDLGLLPGKLKPVVGWAEQLLMRGFNQVSTISQRMFERLAEKGVEKSRSSLFRNWVDCGAIYPLFRPSTLRQSLGISGDAFVVSYAGSMGEKHGLEVVVEAARIMRGDDRVTFVMCGEGSARTRLQTLAAGLGNIRWLPLQPAEEFNEFLNLADIHLLPQRADAADLVMPSKLCGMLASGRVVIATVEPSTEIAETLKEAGVITAPGDAGALADMIDRLRQSVTSRRNMGVFARLYAERNFSVESVLGQFERQLLATVGGSSSAVARMRRKTGAGEGDYLDVLDAPMQLCAADGQTGLRLMSAVPVNSRQSSPVAGSAEVETKERYFPMKAMILAAGKGTRVRPLTYELPKPMIPILGKPLMEYLIEHLALHGVRQLMVNTSHLSQRIEQYFGDGRRFGVEIGYSFEGYIENGEILPLPLGSAGGMKKIQDFGKFFDSTTVVLCGDALVDLDIGAAVAEHRARGAMVSLVAKEVPWDSVSQYGVVVAEPDGRIVSFQEKPRREEALSNWANTGIYIFEPEALDLIPSNSMFDIGSDLFPLLVKRGLPFYAQRQNFNWIDIGKVSDYWTAVQRVMRHEVEGMRNPGTEIKEGVWAGLNTRIDWNGTTITGPVYLGSNCQVEAGCEIIGPTWIGHGCHIRKEARIVRSVIFEHTRVDRGAEFEEQIVCGQYCVAKDGKTMHKDHPEVSRVRWNDARIRAQPEAA